MYATSCAPLQHIIIYHYNNIPACLQKLIIIKKSYFLIRAALNNIILPKRDPPFHNFITPEVSHSFNSFFDWLFSATSLHFLRRIMSHLSFFLRAQDNFRCFLLCQGFIYLP